MMDNQKFGYRIKQIRELRGMSQEKLGDITGFGRVSIGRYENDVTKPGADALIKIADALDCSVDFLLGRTDDPRYEIRIDLPEALKKIGVEGLEMLANEDITPEELQILLEYARKLKKAKDSGDR